MNEVVKELKRFNSELPIEEALTPPSSWYISPEIYELEKRKIFLKNWLCVGRRDQLQNPGSYFSGDHMGEPYLVVKSLDEQIRAFYNVCRHHAAGLLEGEGCVQSLVCPYHGWTYGLDGKLQAAPRCGGIQNFSLNEQSLIPIAVEVLGPFVWINFSSDPRPLREDLGGLMNRLEATGLSHLRFHKRLVYEIQCNWKVYVDNYLDGGYHVPVLHKALSSQLKFSSYRTEVYERYSIQGSEGAASNSRIGKEAIYAWIHPHFMINRYGPVLDTNLVLPLAPDRTITIFDFFFDEKDPLCTEQFIAESLESSERVQQEDIRICESVQKGLASQGFQQGRYAPAVEMAAHRFHQILFNELADQ